jgi:hypothetical protein
MHFPRALHENARNFVRKTSLLPPSHFLTSTLEIRAWSVKLGLFRLENPMALLENMCVNQFINYLLTTYILGVSMLACPSGWANL